LQEVVRRLGKQGERPKEKMAAFAKHGCHVATWNIRTKLGGKAKKLEALVEWARLQQVGAVALQESYSRGIQQDDEVLDSKGGCWALWTARPEQGNGAKGMGFLISGKHRAKQFKVVSSRLCWVEIELAPGKASSQQVSLVNAYAPTEARATEEEVEEFYEELSKELVEVRRLVGSTNVIVLGDL
jgi:hypothetical protein